tara:strand:+ start:419 stop:3511 length:3093 start_codon:yes stop_codon:yes gene_type:complete
MKSFNKINNTIGLLIFAIASFVYLSTIEQTVSFWDCGEYISTAYKLEVGHPPGAPLFQLLGRMFSLFAEPATSQVAVSINILSALCSSLTILFLYWTITGFAQKIKLDYSKNTKQILIFFSGIIGSLTYTFTDSFWFSAVEGEVYAMSSFFTAVTFWCIMKWEKESDKASSSRWLILISYLIGLSIGVHLLSLLTIPAMGMIYYNKKYNYSKLGAIKAFFISLIILVFIQGVIIPGAVSLIYSFELFFTNNLGLPFNCGTIIYFLSIIALITIGLIYTKNKNKPIYNTAILSVLVLLIGYSSFAILVVRSNSNPPIDENNPEDAVGLLSYLKREQYGSWPIIYGQYFNAKLDSKEPYIDGKPIYKKDKKKGKYVIIDKRENSIPNYSSKYKTFFPRMWSNTQSRHANGYRSWANLSKNKDKVPTFGENLSFFFKYQIGWSYLRYFMWNFAGRQNDYMNMDGNPIYGNWESGISFLDKARLGSPDKEYLPNHLKNNKGKNHYYFLPLLLGILGMYFHFKNNKQDAIANLLFFLFTGVLIIVYLNVTPFQPRERDYAYVGSFYAFSIWIGLGIFSVFNFINKHINSKTASILSFIICLFISPVLLALENWDDHNRSGRRTALEVAKNYLDSCDKNAIIFTNGDNDTFPLWYAQEVEDYRTDVKVVNLSLFNTSWYIDQMKRATYDAKPIPSSLTENEYRTGTRDYTLIQERFKEHVDVKDVIKFIRSNSAKAKIRTSAGMRNYCPTKKLKLKVDRDKVLSFVPKKHQSKIVDEIKWKIKGNGIYKNKLMVLDILANFNWERPIYFAITVGRDNFMGLENYFQLEGLAYRLVPYETRSFDGQTGTVEVEKMYERLVDKFNWGGFNNSNLYFDETNTRMVMNFRNNYSRLAEALHQSGDNTRAIETLDKCLFEFPRETVNYSYFAIPIADIYLKAGAKEKGMKVLSDMSEDFMVEYKFFSNFSEKQTVKQNLSLSTQILASLYRLIQSNNLYQPDFNYINENDLFYKQKNDEKIEVPRSEFVINNFVDEFLSLQ